jgi:hypothetical protein
MCIFFRLKAKAAFHLEKMRPVRHGEGKKEIGATDWINADYKSCLRFGVIDYRRLPRRVLVFPLPASVRPLLPFSLADAPPQPRWRARSNQDSSVKPAGTTTMVSKTLPFPCHLCWVPCSSSAPGMPGTAGCSVSVFVSVRLLACCTTFPRFRHPPSDQVARVTPPLR